MSARLATLSFTLFAGVAVTADYLLFKQYTKTLALAGEVRTQSYFDRVTALFGMGPDAAAPSALPGLLPPAPAGWTRAPHQRADGEQATGRRYTTPRPASRSGPAAYRSGNEVLSSLEPTLPNINRVVETYASGELRVIVALTYRPERAAGGASPLVDHLARMLNANPDDLPLYGTVQGVDLWQKPLLQLDPRAAPAFRYLLGAVGDRVQIEVLTNTPDEPLRAVVGRIDMGGLAALAGVSSPADAAKLGLPRRRRPNRNPSRNPNLSRKQNRNQTRNRVRERITLNPSRSAPC